MGKYYTRLHAKQRRLLEIIISNPTMPYTEACERAEIPRSTYYTWRNTENWKMALDERIKEIWKDSENEMVQNMLGIARGGNFQATKYVLDSLGYQPAQKLEVDSKTTIKVNITDDEE